MRAAIMVNPAKPDVADLREQVDKTLAAAGCPYTLVGSEVRAAPSNMCLSRKYRGSVSVIERPGWSGKPIDDLRAIVAVLVFGAG